MESSLEVGLEGHLLKVKRWSETPKPENYFATPLSEYKQGKRYTLPFPITNEENRQLFLLTEVFDADLLRQERVLSVQQKKEERLQWIYDTFGDQLWEDEESDEIDELMETEKPSTEDDQETGEKEVESDEESAVESELEEETERCYVAVFSHHKKIYCIWGTVQQVYHSLVRVRMEVKKVRLNSEKLEFQLGTNVENIYHLKVGESFLQVGMLTSEPVTPVVQDRMPNFHELKNSKYSLTLSIPTPDIANHDAGDDSAVQMEGNTCTFVVMIEGVPVQYRIVKVVEKKDKWGFSHSPREHYVPIVSTWYEPCALHVRRSCAGTFVLFKRFMEPVEREPFFRFMESRPVSGFLFTLGRILNHVPGRKKVALFNEKYSAKAEEGAFELFQECSRSKKTKCYFIIDEHSPDYPAIKDVPHVVRKYSFLYYWLMFNVNYYISTESPIHLNILNSNNHYIRFNVIRHPFVFLQHGVTYLKRQGKRSTYVKGKAGEASYVVVGSEKEKKVVSEMLHLEESRIWKTGMLIFDKCQYKHINQDSEDFVTIMLTWKPYEEHLTNFEDSTYFKYTMQTYELLQQYVDRSKIIIVSHPRAHALLMSTSIRDLVWEHPVSEALKKTKLLVTDYSSVCWNTFYQGGGVVFLQPDLEPYEAYVGKLIPKPNEYIGHRVFDFDALNQVFAAGLKNGAVDLSYFRTPENEAMYETVNEFHDGKNSERLYETLVEKGFM